MQTLTSLDPLPDGHLQHAPSFAEDQLKIRPDDCKRYDFATQGFWVNPRQRQSDSNYREFGIDIQRNVKYTVHLLNLEIVET